MKGAINTYSLFLLVSAAYTAATAHLQLALVALPVETQVLADISDVQQVARAAWGQLTGSVSRAVNVLVLG